MGDNMVMGLDYVELIMDVEDEFGIEITDQMHSRVVTVGDLHREVVGAMRRSDTGSTVDEHVVWDRLRVLVCETSGVRPDRVTPTARIVEDLRIG